MPRYYCDYCDTYLTHDSQAGRKQHNRGWKHRENVKAYYEQFLNDAGAIMMAEFVPGAWLRPVAPSARPPMPMHAKYGPSGPTQHGGIMTQPPPGPYGARATPLPYTAQAGLAGPPPGPGGIPPAHMNQGPRMIGGPPPGPPTRHMVPPPGPPGMRPPSFGHAS